MWVRAGLLQPLATTQQPAQVVLSEQSDKSDITELTIRLIRVCQSVPKLAPRLQLLEQTTFFRSAKWRGDQLGQNRWGHGMA